MEQLKFRIIKPILTQRKSTDLSSRKTQRDFPSNINIFNSPQPYSNISYRKTHKHKALSQGTFYGSPLLGQNQLEMIDKMKSQKRNDFYAQLKSIDPYQYPTKLSDLHLSPKSPREPTVEVVIPTELREPTLTIGRFSENLSRHNPRDKIHRGIPQKHDIKSLATWVDLMVQQTLDRYGDSKCIDFYEEVQNILTLCLKELIRQISIDCIERSVLLEKIWAQYVEINSSVIKQVLDEKEELEKQNLKQVMRTHQLYQVEIDNYQLIIKNLKDEQVQLTERLIKLKDNGKYLKKTNRHLQTSTKEMRFQLNDITLNNKYLHSEIENLKQYIEEAEQDFQSQQQQFKAQLFFKQESPQQSPRKKSMNRAGTLCFNPQQPREQLKIIRAGKHKTFFKEPKQEEKVKKILKSDSESANNSDIEDILKTQSTDTFDLISIMELQKEQSTQIIVAAETNTTSKSYLMPETYQKAAQTDISMKYIATKETQTEILNDMVEVIKTEEEQLLQIQDHLMKVSAHYNSIKNEQAGEESPNKISQFFLSLGDASNKMKQTIHMQREIRTSLILVNSAQKDENLRKQDQILSLKSTNDDLSKNIDNVMQEIHELESQLEFQEKINQKLEKKYNKIRDRKQQLVDKTQNLINSFQKTQKFTNIMKKKILDKRINGAVPRKTMQPPTQQGQSNDTISQFMTQQVTQQTPKNNTQQQAQKQTMSQKNLSPILEHQQKGSQFQNNTLTIQSNNKLELENSSSVHQDNSRSSITSPQIISQSQEGSMPKKKWNIHITNADEKKKQSDEESDHSQSQQSLQNNSFNSIQDDQNDAFSQKSGVTNRSKLSTQVQNKPRSSNYQLIPGNSSSRSQVKTLNKDKKEKNNPNTSNLQSNDSMKLFSETLKQFINEELDQSDTSSMDSSFSYKLEDFNKRKLESNQRRKNVTSVQAPKFQNRNTAESTSQLNYQRSHAIVLSLSDRFSKSQKGISAKMQKINVLKFISQFYCEKIRQYQNKNMPLHQICYEYFVNTYGFKTMAEQKLTNFYYSIFVYRENFRINLFGRFIELFSPLTLDDLENYMQSMKFLDENDQAIQLAQVVNEKGVLVSLDKAIMNLEQQHSCLPADIRDKIIKEIRVNTFERKGKYCVDLDFFISKVLTGYHKLKMMHQAHFEEVFYSADMDMDGMIEFQEFQKLYLHFEINQGTTSNQKIIRSQFMERCDTISNESGEKAMTFDRFVTFSLENNIFSEEKFKRFSKNVDPSDPIKDLSDLKVHWSNIQQLLTSRINLSKPEEAQYYYSIIQKLDSALTNRQLKESYWISYRILDADTKALYLDKVVQSLVPDELLQIQELMNEIFDDNIQYMSD